MRIYISAKEYFFFLGLKKGTHCILVLRAHTDWILGVEREKLIEPRFSYHHGLNIFLDTSGARKWLSMTLIKVSISFIVILIHALMSTCDPMSFKISSWSWFKVNITHLIIKHFSFSVKWNIFMKVYKMGVKYMRIISIKL